MDVGTLKGMPNEGKGSDSSQLDSVLAPTWKFSALLELLGVSELQKLSPISNIEFTFPNLEPSTLQIHRQQKKNLAENGIIKWNKQPSR